MTTAATTKQFEVIRHYPIGWTIVDHTRPANRQEVKDDSLTLQDAEGYCAALNDGSATPEYARAETVRPIFDHAAYVDGLIAAGYDFTHIAPHGATIPETLAALQHLNAAIEEGRVIRIEPSFSYYPFIFRPVSPARS